LHYAIADVGFFVSHGDALDEEAWTRGVTVYMPDERARLYPAILSEGAASLLPDGPRPAVVFIVAVDDSGAARLEGVERALVRSHAKLAYETVRPADLPPELHELARRVDAAEDARGAPRVEFPEQELVDEDGHWALRFDPRLASEDVNAGLSLATNLAVADALLAAQTGLFRVMPEPTEGAVRRLRQTALAFGLAWPAAQSLADFQRGLRTDDPRAAAFLLAVRRAGGGASYEPYSQDATPWHAAMAAAYAHATAPLRRLADRYVVEAVLAIANGQVVPDEVTAAFGDLPTAMAKGEQRANGVERAVIDLAEAVLLAERIGSVFDAVVVDEDRRGAVVQLVEPAVLARVAADGVEPGDAVRVRLVAVDAVARTIEFSRIG
jgi:exoribonuclease R